MRKLWLKYMWTRSIRTIGFELKVSRFRLKGTLPIRCIEEVLVGLTDMIEVLQYFKGFERFQNKISRWDKSQYIAKWVKGGMDIPYAMILEAKQSEPFDLVDIYIKDAANEIKVKVRVK